MAGRYAGWDEHSWNSGDKQPYAAVWSEETLDKKQEAISLLGLGLDLFASLSASDQNKLKSAKLSQWAGHDGWMYKRGTGLVTFYYISPDGQEYATNSRRSLRTAICCHDCFACLDCPRYTSEQEAELAYKAYEEESDESLEPSPVSRAAKAAAAAAAAIAEGGSGTKTKRPRAASSDSGAESDGSPTKKPRAASPNGDARAAGALSARQDSGSVSALDCSPVHDPSICSISVISWDVSKLFGCARGRALAGALSMTLALAVLWRCSGRRMCAGSHSVQHLSKTVPGKMPTTESIRGNTRDPFRYEGEIMAFSKKSRKHRVRYTDGREEWSDLVACGRFLSDDADGDALVSAPSTNGDKICCLFI